MGYYTFDGKVLNTKGSFQPWEITCIERENILKTGEVCEKDFQRVREEIRGTSGIPIFKSTMHSLNSRSLKKVLTTGLSTLKYSQDEGLDRIGKKHPGNLLLDFKRLIDL